MRYFLLKLLEGIVRSLKKKMVSEHEEKHDTVVSELKSIEKPKSIPLKETKIVHWIKSPNFSSRGNRTISVIVLHHTGPGGLEATISWMKNDESNVSYHYIIDTDGKLYQMVKEANKAWHAGRASFRGERGVNSLSIGVALVGEGKEKFTDAQYKSVAWLCDMLKKKYRIPNENIVGHKDVSPGRKTDPEPFDRERFLKDLNS